MGESLIIFSNFLPIYSKLLTIYVELRLIYIANFVLLYGWRRMLIGNVDVIYLRLQPKDRKE
jgi:hypothetical protein